MKNYFILFLIYTKSVLCEIFQLKKIPTNIKSLRRYRRNLDYDKEDAFLEKAYGDSHNLNYYYTTLYLGPKKTPQTYILDTGSPTTTSPCNKCTSCGDHINKPYKLDRDSDIIKCNSNECNLVSSSTCLNNKCSFRISYSEGSKLEGFFTMQEISFENIIGKTPQLTKKSFVLPIGCTTTETHLFLTQLADGIMGLNNSGKSFISLLYNSKIISKNLFSICLAENDGYFSIGEIDTTFHEEEIKYTPYSRGESYFYININKIKIGNKTIDTKKYKVFIDSGTTITYFPKDIYRSIKEEFNSVCRQKGKNCGVFNDYSGLGYCGLFKNIKDKEKALNEYWPNITVVFDGYNYTLTPRDYYYDYSEDEIGACLGFEGESASKITFGGTFMHGHDIIFDRENQRIGFAAADCNRGQPFNRPNTNPVNNYKFKFEYITFVYLLALFLITLLITYLIYWGINIIARIKKYKRQVDEIQNNQTTGKENNSIQVKS